MQQFEQIKTVEKRKETREELERLGDCLEKHVVDIEPGWEGSKNLKKSVSGGFMGAAETSINRCEPEIEISKISFLGGKSVALIGPNGSGKSTLFDAFMEKEDAGFSGGAHGHNKGVHGKETLRIARLNQEEILSDIKDLEVEEVLGLITKRFRQEFPIDWEDIDAYDRNLLNQEAEQRIEELMSQVRALFDIDIFKDRKVSELSGGERTKLSLLMLLGSEADVLFLDEPTNHLDLESISKLTGLFEKYKRAGVSVVNVSHVEWFLEMAGQDGTIEIKTAAEKREVISSTSPYAKYVKKEPDVNLIKNDISWNKEYEPKQDATLFLTDITFTVSESPLKDIKFPTIRPGDLVVFSGNNGTGKTKLMEEIVDPKSKVIKKEKGAQVAYLPQFWPDEVAKGTVQNFFDWVKETINQHSDKQASRFLKELRDIGFREGDKSTLNKKLSSFSGGEQRLLWFVAASIFEGTDVLVLDEPSNHMDSATMKRVLNAIRNFKGAVALSSHDLRLMKELDKDAGNIRAGKGVRNIIFTRENDKTTIEESKTGPTKYAEEVIQKAKKQAGRVKIN